MLKKIALALAVVAMPVCAQADSASLTVQVTDIADKTGAVVMAVYDTAEAFDGGGQPVKAARIDVTGADVTVSFDDLSQGLFAIKLYHDANGNGQLDTNLMGLPIEGYGFSGDGEHVGPPTFDAASFTIDAGSENAIAIRLR